VKEFTTTIRRAVTIRAADPALEPAEFVIEMSEVGVAVRRAGASKSTARKATWRTIIGTILIHQR
jgi:hypothetical protein